MKVNIQKALRRIIPILTCLTVLVLSLAAPTNAAELDPQDYIYEYAVEDEKAWLTLSIPTEYCEWERVLDGKVVSDWYGSGFSYKATENLLDNIEINCFPLGLDYMVVDGGNYGRNVLDISDFTQTFTLEYAGEVALMFNEALTQPFVINVYFEYVLMDDTNSDGIYEWLDRQSVVVNSITVPAGGTYFTQRIEHTAIIDRYLADIDYTVPYMQFNYTFEFNGIDDESVTSKVTYYFTNMQTLFRISISELYYESLVSGETNKLLDNVNDQLEDMGTTMEEVLTAEQENGEKLDDILGAQEETNDKLDEIISGSDDQQFAADELDGDMAEVTDKMDSAVGDLNSAGEVLGSVEQPEISFDSLVPGELLGASYVSFVNVLSCVWANSTLSQMMSVMTGMVIISLLLFGKKG